MYENKVFIALMFLVMLPLILAIFESIWSAIVEKKERKKRLNERQKEKGNK